MNCQAEVAVPVDDLHDSLYPVEIFVQQCLSNGLIHSASHALRPGNNILKYSDMVFHSTPWDAMEWEIRVGVKQTALSATIVCDVLK